MARGDFLDLDGRRIFWWEQGTGPPILALHGFPASSYDWRYLAGLFPGHRFIAFDLPGFGLSDKSPTGDYSLEGHATVAERLLAHLKVDACDVVAHDIGDSVAAELMHRFNTRSLSFKLGRVALLNGSIFIDLAQLTSGQKLFLKLPPRPLRFAPPVRMFRRQIKSLFSPEHRPRDDEFEMMELFLQHDDGIRIIPITIRYINERRRNQQRWTESLVEFQGELAALWGELVLSAACPGTAQVATSCLQELGDPLTDLVMSLVDDSVLTLCQDLAANQCVDLVSDVADTLADSLFGQICPTATGGGPCAMYVVEYAASSLLATCSVQFNPCSEPEAIFEAVSSLLEQQCGALFALTRSCLGSNLEMSLNPGQAISDFVLTSGFCEDKEVVTVLFLPYGVYEKNVDITDLSNCGTEVGPISSVGTPGGQEPYDRVTDDEADSDLNPDDGNGGGNHNWNCYDAQTNWIRTSMTIQGVANDDLAWLRTTMKRLWGCGSTWWSEKTDGGYESKVFGYQGTTRDFHWWDPEQYPVFDPSNWQCDPPAECASADQHVDAAWRLDAPNPCGRDQVIRIEVNVYTMADGDKLVNWNRKGHCGGLKYPNRVKINKRRDESPTQTTPGGYGGDPQDVYCFARPKHLRSCREGSRP